MKNTLKDKAKDFLEEVVKGNIAAAYEKYISKKCIHHNHYFKGEIEILQRAMEEAHLQQPNKIFEIKHAIQEDKMVAIHSYMRLDKDDIGGTVVHMFRFDESEMVVEFWDIAQFGMTEIANENGLF